MDFAYPPTEYPEFAEPVQEVPLHVSTKAPHMFDIDRFDPSLMFSSGDNNGHVNDEDSLTSLMFRNAMDIFRFNEGEQQQQQQQQQQGTGGRLPQLHQGPTAPPSSELPNSNGEETLLGSLVDRFQDRNLRAVAAREIHPLNKAPSGKGVKRRSSAPHETQHENGVLDALHESLANEKEVLKRTTSCPAGYEEKTEKKGTEKKKRTRPMSTVLANRRSAARSRERRLLYVSELEEKVNELKTQVMQLSHELNSEKINHHTTQAENTAMRLRLQSK